MLPLSPGAGREEAVAEAAAGEGVREEEQAGRKEILSVDTAVRWEGSRKARKRGKRGKEEEREEEREKRRERDYKEEPQEKRKKK
jgi:hypothetical protein